MAFTFDDLVAEPPVFKPVEVPITGLEQPLLIHVFTMDQMAKIVEQVDCEDAEEKLRMQVVYFLRGAAEVPTPEDCAKLSGIFAGFQVREIYTKALRLNGFGPEAMREAEKN